MEFFIYIGSSFSKIFWKYSYSEHIVLWTVIPTYDVICVLSEVTPEHKSNLNAVARALTSSGEWGSLSLYITDCSAQ